MESDAFGKPHASEFTPVDVRMTHSRAVDPLQISPLSRAQESSLCDTVTLLAEANAKLGETIVAQGDQIIQLNEQLRVSRNLTAK